MMDTKKIRSLVLLMVKNDLTELEIQEGENKVSLKRRLNGLDPSATVGPGVTVVPAAVPAPAVPAAPAAEAAPTTEEEYPTVNSPMVGTFYAAASPEAESYAKVGDEVGPDTVICVVEAMKVMNEIKAEVAGTIAKVLVQNGQAVEFGQPLFSIKPN